MEEQPEANPESSTPAEDLDPAPTKTSNIPDFNSYIREMLKGIQKLDISKEPEQEELTGPQFHVFKKLPYLDLSLLQTKTKLVQRNKISDKMSRRDIQYFDLYALKQPLDQYNSLAQDLGFPYQRHHAMLK